MSGTSKTEIGATLTAAPLHEQVTNRISSRIADGRWPEGFVLPSEGDLAKQLGVSEGTIRRAMQALTQEGLVMRRRRTGTVVTGRAPRHSLDKWYSYYRLHARDGRLVNTETRNIEVLRGKASEVEAARLKLTPGEPVGHITRLRLFEGRPVMIDRIVLPLARLGHFPDRVEDLPQLLFKWLLEEHGLRLGALREQVTARIATEADRSLLGIEDSAPVALLDIDETAYDALNEPLMMMRHAALTDQHCYVNEVR
ncbi:GntR family transcriptional regulator [Jannaschia sp. M317]|uniref:GntR family transcriptional regulator n=1 Tax=Jannaschia sp. M317 TaxID=2867011 RepID=UPI0021A2C1FD|nr:GntR family transcriptional regulator [Jannaschia sp. M317]UWQ16428.1 GntR family transcriptional regulator [Jannaschia sp. M317]